MVSERSRGNGTVHEKQRGRYGERDGEERKGTQRLTARIREYSSSGSSAVPVEQCRLPSIVPVNSVGTDGNKKLWQYRSAGLVA